MSVSDAAASAEKERAGRVACSLCVSYRCDRNTSDVRHWSWIRTGTCDLPKGGLSLAYMTHGSCPSGAPGTRYARSWNCPMSVGSFVSATYSTSLGLADVVEEEGCGGAADDEEADEANIEAFLRLLLLRSPPPTPLGIAPFVLLVLLLCTRGTCMTHCSVFEPPLRTDD